MTATPPPPMPDAWAAAAASPEFRALVREKTSVVVPMLAIYLGSYLGTTALCGFFPGIAGIRLWGGLNLGYALIGLNYLLSWGLGMLYVRAANRRFDPLAAAARAVAPRAAAPGGRRA